MTRTRHARVRDIFLEASQRPESERDAYLEAACGAEPAMRREVESLLLHHEEPTTVEPTSRSTRPGRRRRTRFEAGHVFAGRYRIINELGRGGMGEVFRAHDLVLDEPVAIKFLPNTGRDHLDQLLNEVRMARQVSHPNVCRVFDFGEAEDETYLTMEYVDGENLASLLARIGRIPQDKLIELTRQLVAGLAAAHGRGVLHRDLKPANIMIDGRGRARITDFGIATSGVDDSRAGGTRAGTPAYMSPEQISPGELSVQSDLYALGLVLYEMATGQQVFEAETPMAYAELHRTALPKPPSHLVDRLDPSLEAVIIQCLEKDPKARPASALAVLSVLPGGDSLQLALDAGETPSPEVVAAAGQQYALEPSHARALGALLFLLLVLVTVLGDRAYPGRTTWSQTPPEVMVNRANVILDELGIESEATDRAWGFVRHFDLPEDEAGLFWYRQASSTLIPEHLFAMRVARVDFWDPPPTERGMLRMLIEPSGNLNYLHSVPPAPSQDEPSEENEGSEEDSEEDDEGEAQSAPEADANARADDTDPAPQAPGEPAEEPAEPETAAVDVPETESTADPASEPTPEVDWATLLRAAGFDPETARTAPVDKIPPTHADQRVAWTAPRDGMEYLLEAASRDGTVVYFEALPQNIEEPESFFDFQQLWLSYINLRRFFWLILVIAALILARINLRAGRGDLRGARRLAFLLFGMHVAVWLLQADHVPHARAELFLFEANVSRILLEAMIVWLAYVALEPIVRRWWPRALISWNRLLYGRLNDPLVGKGLLIGSVAGTWWALATQLDRLITRGLGLTDAGEIFVRSQLDVALSGRLLFAQVLDDCLQAGTTAVLDLFFLVALRVVFKRWWMAIVIFVLTHGVLETLEGFHPLVSWATLGIGITGVTVVLLIRYGLLAYATALFCYYILVFAPATLSFEAWYAETGLFIVLLIAALGAFSVRAALYGRPVTPTVIEPS